MVTRVRLTFLVLFLCLIDTASAYASRRYTVDDMLAVESIGEAQFDPSGQRLIFERYGPFDRQSNYGRDFVLGELRSRIYAVDLTNQAPPSLLFTQSPGDGYTISGMSPDGTLLAVNRVSETGFASGVVPLAGGAPTMFEFSPSAARIPMQALPWIRGGVILSAGRLGEVNDYDPIGDLGAVAALWARRNRGEVPTSVRVGSGRFASLPEPEGGLVFAQAGNSRVRMFAGGRFSLWHVSADGSALAALREERLVIDPNQRIDHGANIGGIQRRLLILDPHAGINQQPRQPCRGCDVLISSLNWSATAPLLSFVARDERAEWSTARYHIYDHRTGDTRAINLGALKAHADRSQVGLDIRSTWIGDRLAVLAERPEAPVNTRGDRRADWYLLGDGAPANLTGAFAGADSPELVAIGRDSLVVIHGGDAWRIDATGNKRNLTARIPEPVRAWRAPSPFAHLPVYNCQPSETLVLQIASEHAGSPDGLLLVNLETARIDTVTAPSEHSEFLAASAVSRRAALVERNGNVTSFMVVGADGSRRELARLNEHLRGVVGGTPIRVDHKGPSGDNRMSWILLPPDYRSGHPVPTVVNVYPGAVGRESWSRYELDKVHALNDHILAARGYAILYPSLPVRYENVPRDPLKGLTEEVFAAVDAAIARGFVDPERMAVQGQSYGGYTTGALIGLTSRFKSAVAQAGLYDLISSYGQFDIRRRLDIERNGLDLFAASWMETSQGGMGAPPWDDPERYLRNSPLTHVRNVSTPIMLITGDQDFVSTTQTEEFFTALTRLGKDAVMVSYFGEGHVFNSPANIRDMWGRVVEWYDATIGSPERAQVPSSSSTLRP